MKLRLICINIIIRKPNKREKKKKTEQIVVSEQVYRYFHVGDWPGDCSATRALSPLIDRELADEIGKREELSNKKLLRLFCPPAAEKPEMSTAVIHADYGVLIYCIS